ncbi:hypothetical protein ACLOJK_006454 [Asimina triloba]
MKHLIWCSTFSKLLSTNPWPTGQTDGNNVFIPDPAAPPLSPSDSTGNAVNSSSNFIFSGLFATDEIHGFRQTQPRSETHIGSDRWHLLHSTCSEPIHGGFSLSNPAAPTATSDERKSDGYQRRGLFFILLVGDHQSRPKMEQQQWVLKPNRNGSKIRKWQINWGNRAPS